jgi:sulfite exporter TauE/SafE
MSALIFSVFVASLLGSMHCAGMCGAFVAFAVGFDENGVKPRRWPLHAAYNGGRLITYAALGAIAGGIGGALNLAGSMVGVTRVAAAVAGATLIVFGGAHLLRALGMRLKPVRPPKAMQNALRAANRAAMAMPPVRRALVIGLMTTLLPCGWLYAFVAAAAGTGDAALGALTMAVFWAGTLPMLVAVGAGVRALAGPLASRLPVLMPLLVIGAGLYTIVSRLGVSPQALDRVASSVQAASLEQSVEAVTDLDPESMPCCSDGAAEESADHGG